MHKDFYASGFIYHSKTQQILLQQNNTEEWTLLGGNSLKNETVEQAFKRVVSKILEIKQSIPVQTVYNYFNDELKKDHYVSYITIRKLENFEGSKKTFEWFNFKQIGKLKLSAQCKQDIIVSKRVIDSSIRKSLGQQTIG